MVVLGRPKSRLYERRTVTLLTNKFELSRGMSMKSMARAKKIIGVAALLAVTNSWGYTISGGTTDVGGLDTLLGYSSGLVNSNPTTETNWVNSILNPDTTFTLKEETVSYQQVDGGGAWAFALQSDPGYYVIKNAKFWALFQNEASLDWAVFNTLLLPGGINLGGDGQFTISHVSEFGGSTSVPEPGSLALIAAGALGLAATRRFARKA